MGWRDENEEYDALKLPFENIWGSSVATKLPMAENEMKLRFLENDAIMVVPNIKTIASNFFVGGKRQ